MSELTDTSETYEPGQQDVPMPGSEPLGPETEGEFAGPPAELDAVYSRRIAAFAAVLENATEAWVAAGKTDDEIDELGGQLRMLMMGERP